MFQVILIIFSLLLTGCLGFRSATWENNLEDPLGSMVDGSPQQMYADGVQLYETNCKICHGSITSAEIRGKKSSDIKHQISTNLEMRHLRFLKDFEIDAIELALSGRVPPPPPGPGGMNNGRAIVYRPPMANRNYLTSHLQMIFYDFSNPGSEDQNILTAIRDNITRQVATLGGPCTRFDRKVFDDNESCHVAPGGSFAANSEADIVPVGTSLRKGRTNGVCQAILSNDKAVRTAMSNAGLSTSSTGTTQEMNALFELFHPGISPDSVVATALMSLHSSGSNRSATDRWRIVLMALCASPNGDLL